MFGITFALFIPPKWQPFVSPSLIVDRPRIKRTKTRIEISEEISIISII